MGLCGLRCDLRKLDEYGIVANEVPVAQWIEHRSPEPGALVRFQSGTLSNRKRFQKPKWPKREEVENPLFGPIFYQVLVRRRG